MTRLLALLCSIFLVGCDGENSTDTDQCLRRELFNECMHEIPPGPSTTHYNDWDEVVRACKDYSFWAAQRIIKNIKEECKQ